MLLIIAAVSSLAGSVGAYIGFIHGYQHGALMQGFMDSVYSGLKLGRWYDRHKFITVEKPAILSFEVNNALLDTFCYEENLKIFPLRYLQNGIFPQQKAILAQIGGNFDEVISKFRSHAREYPYHFEEVDVEGASSSWSHFVDMGVMSNRELEAGVKCYIAHNEFVRTIQR
jgi:hypothetical protein